jgi:hypothetical protein
MVLIASLDVFANLCNQAAFECCMLHSEHECELEKIEKEKQNPSSSLSQGGFDEYKWVERNSFQKNNAQAPQLAFVLLFVLLCITTIWFNSSF